MKAVTIYNRLIPNIDNAILRTSKAGVPHLVVGTDHEMKYSIVWFEKTKTIRVFYPYPSKEVQQTRKDFKTTDEVIKFFKLNQKY
jgi:hypothetical protein